MNTAAPSARSIGRGLPKERDSLPPPCHDTRTPPITASTMARTAAREMRSPRNTAAMGATIKGFKYQTGMTLVTCPRRSATRYSTRLTDTMAPDSQPPR